MARDEVKGNGLTTLPGELERVIGFKDLLFIAMGQIIGAGVVALTGVAIGMTGPRSFSPIRWRRSLRS